MEWSDCAGDVVRVERGLADADEVAAVTVVLLSRLAGMRQAADESPDVTARARWDHERIVPYRPPYSWR